MPQKISCAPAARPKIQFTPDFPMKQDLAQFFRAPSARDNYDIINFLMTSD